ncbi:MAG: tRNA epoxyqueuosine(34) reductase QueG [Candidatus Wallbacteria bacterium]|nr:tRNA epoxyqueuosine(34) reductase QueG [Candidatus Wallbacteria bacterium]
MLEGRQLAEAIKRRAAALGFDDARIGPAAALTDDRDRLARWLDAGRHGEMDYMRAEFEARADPARQFPGARSVVALALSYYPGEHPPAPAPGTGRVARYAWGRDYHRFVGLKLRGLKEEIRRLAPAARVRSFVDHSPLLERAFAARSGLGFVGKNTMLIHRRLGSWTVLAAIVTDLDLPVDVIDSGDCGRCTLCLEACPTGAFPAPYELDATRCISYWTIEASAPPPPELAARFGDWVFGCDVCQEVCPYNHRPLDASHGSRLSRAGSAGPWLDSKTLARQDAAAFKRRFKLTPPMRPGAERMARNLRTAVANTKRRRATIPPAAEGAPP